MVKIVSIHSVNAKQTIVTDFMTLTHSFTFSLSEPLQKTHFVPIPLPIKKVIIDRAPSVENSDIKQSY